MRTRAGAVGPSSSSTPSRKRAQRLALGISFDLGEVRLLDAVSRMREQLGEVTVVGEEQQALGVVVEAADGNTRGSSGTSSTTVGRPWDRWRS